MKRSKEKESEEKVLLFSSGMIFAVGMSTSLIGHVVPAALMGVAVVVCLSLVESNEHPKLKK
jgi:hypothetical protein